MELKKSVKADLERRKPTFFQIGLLVTLLVVFLAFELVGTSDKPDEGYTGIVVLAEEDQMIQTEEQKQPEQPQQQQEPQASAIEVVRNNVTVADFTITSEYFEGDLVQEQGYVEIDEGPGEKIEEAPIFEIVEELPGFKGGDAARQRYLRDNTVYPTSAMSMNIEGTVIVSFVVEPDGSISNVKILRGVVASLDEEAIRVTKSMPKWDPGKQRGKPVRARFNMPIKFVIGD